MGPRRARTRQIIDIGKNHPIELATTVLGHLPDIEVYDSTTLRQLSAWVDLGPRDLTIGMIESGNGPATRTWRESVQSQTHFVG